MRNLFGSGGISRREFVGALAVAGIAGRFRRYQGDGIGPIGLQLYTVRDAFARDPESTLEQVAVIGYTEVEFTGYGPRTPASLRATLDRLGLTAPSGQLPSEALSQGWEAALDGAALLGHRFVVIASFPKEERKTLDDWRRIADRINQAAAAARSRGLQFCYHNHDFEFRPIDGTLPYDVLLEAADPDLVRLELDVYWITKGGQDPLAYFARYPGRFPLVHVKDSTGPRAHRMVDVGQGTIDWRRIFRQRAQAGIEHCFVEHDKPADAFQSIRISYDYLSQLRL